MGDSQCARDLERLGHLGQVTLEFDQEPAIVDVEGDRESSWSRGTLLEHSLVADSQSNGFHERGIRSVEEMTGVLLFDLSSRVGSLIPSTRWCFRGLSSTQRTF